LKAYNKNVPSSTKHNLKINLIFSNNKNQISSNLSKEHTMKCDSIVPDPLELTINNKNSNSRSITPKISKKENSLKNYSTNQTTTMNNVSCLQTEKKNIIIQRKNRI